MRAIASVLCVAIVSFWANAAAAGSTFEKVKVEAGERLYVAECRRCHAPDTDHASYGPTLENVIGRTAGSVPQYEYSDALAKSGIVWTPAALRAWMEDNTGFMPGTKMRHVGIADRTVQDFILSYLASISEKE